MTSYGLGDAGFESRQEQEISVLSQLSRPISGAHLAFSSKGIDVLFPVVKRPGRDIDHSSPSRAGLRVTGTVPVLPLYSFVAWTDTTAPLPVQLDWKSGYSSPSRADFNGWSISSTFSWLYGVGLTHG